ncbi:hypothetical protein QBC46DRAFT_415963 [Diplogelasinospora grovesii]|uniref:Small secreted protein n=1 Tax=Diplogelasinospora grovesii TaxID=303347 RepID=A0AAN6N3I3_9PEZI|nr:hypothetical protein QBC46DRAFT_415963 [Diplogelasinospora grovesii]
MSVTHLLVPTLAFLAASAVAQLRLNVTAIGAQNGILTLECWEVDSPFYTSSDSATVGAKVAHLGNVSTLSWSVVPPGHYVSPHNAPYNQQVHLTWCRWVILLKGFGHITLPHDNSTGAYITGGEFGVIFAADTADVSCDGHISTYLSSTESVYLQIPTQDGTVPEHNRLHMGPCVAEEMAGLRMGNHLMHRSR